LSIPLPSAWALSSILRCPAAGIGTETTKRKRAEKKKRLLSLFGLLVGKQEDTHNN